MNITLSFNRALALWPDSCAVIDQDVHFTYRQFGERVARLINALFKRGVKRGQMVAIIAPNCHQFMEAYYACALAGIVLVPINFRLAAPEIVAILADSTAKVLMVHKDFKESAKAVLASGTELDFVIWVGLNLEAYADPVSTIEQAVTASVDSACEPVTDAPPDSALSAESNVASHFDLAVVSSLSARCQPAIAFANYEEELCRASDIMPALPSLTADNLAQLYYTSGTTGSAKGVMLTHGNVACHALSAIAELGLSDSDTWMHAAPMFHLADAWATFAMTWVGAKHVFVPYFAADDVLSTIERERVTISNLVPTMLTAMTNYSEVERFDYSSLRMIMSGGAPIAPEIVRRIVNTFGCDYTQTYGMTETSPYLTLSCLKSHLKQLPFDQQLAIKSRTGRPFLGVDLKVVRVDGNMVAWDDCEVGEIVVRGPTVTPGYWGKESVTAETIVDGWLYTGDLAVVDAEGYVNIVDRKKDMIITGGENVYSTEVEHVLYEHPAVLECAVFGVPDKQWGEVVRAAIVLRQSHCVSEEALIAFVRKRLAGYKTPKSLVFLDSLPKTGSGKIMKTSLRSPDVTHP